MENSSILSNIINNNTVINNTVINNTVNNNTENIQINIICLLNNKIQFIKWTEFIQIVYNIIHSYVYSNISNYDYNYDSQKNEFAEMMNKLDNHMKKMIIDINNLNDDEFYNQKILYNRTFHKYITIIKNFYNFFQLHKYNLSYNLYTHNTFTNYENWVVKNIPFEKINTPYLNNMMDIINILYKN